MFDVKTPVAFFLGANTPQGFCGYHRELYDGRDGWRAFLIKSGPGTGKSSLMKRLVAEMDAEGIATEAIYCSSDPHSLDGVIAPSLKALIFDATAPHILEPGYWGAVEQIVDLGRCMNTDALHEQAPAIIDATDACARMHARCRQYMGAAATLLADNRRLSLTCTDCNKVTATAARIATREWGSKNDQNGHETRRFLSALTPEGMVTFTETLQTLCPHLYAIEDDHGAASSMLMAELRRRALAAGLSVISCASPLFPQESPEHLLIPERGLGFTVSNAFHRAEFPVYRRMRAERFTDSDALRATREKRAFNRKAAREMLQEAEACAREAKRLHDRMEELYHPAVDWQRVSVMQEHMAGVWRALAQQKGSDA